MKSLESDLAERLAALQEQNLFRELRPVDSPQSHHIQIGGKSFLNFSSNDYLGLANHPALKEAAGRRSRNVWRRFRSVQVDLRFTRAFS